MFQWQTDIMSTDISSYLKVVKRGSSLEGRPYYLHDTVRVTYHFFYIIKLCIVLFYLLWIYRRCLVHFPGHFDLYFRHIIFSGALDYQLEFF